MRTKLVIFVLLLSTCITLSGQQAKTATTQKQPQKTTTQILNEQQEVISQLQADNKKLQETNDKLQDQLDRVEKEIEVYREDVRIQTSEMHSDMNILLAILTIIMTIVGIVVPVLINRNNSENMKTKVDEAKDKANSAKEKAEEAQKSVYEIEDLKKTIDQMQAHIKKDKDEAMKAAQKARASQLFSQAVYEKNEIKAIELYKQAINLNPNDVVFYNNLADSLLKINNLPEALNIINIAINKDDNKAFVYLTRGQILLAMDRPSDAIIDFDKGLSMDSSIKEGFESRAKCLRELAKKEKDKVKKAELLEKAKADEEKAQSMK